LEGQRQFKELSGKEPLLSDIIEAAKQYTALGWYVLPTLGKVPQGGANWQHKTTNDEEQLDAVFAVRHDGLGVQLGEKSGIVDIECDSEDAERYFFELLGGEIPQTPTFQSTRGKHYLFRWRDDLPAVAVFKLNGLEFRLGNGKAAQSVFPPSAGRTWEIGPETPVAEFPAWETVLAAYAEEKRPRAKPVAMRFESRSESETLNVPRWLAKHGREILGAWDGDGCRRWYIECPGIDAHTTGNSTHDCCITQDAQGRLGGCCFHQSCGMTDWGRLRDAIGGLEYSDFHDEEPTAGVCLDGLFQAAGKPDEPRKETPKTRVPRELIDVPGFLNDLVAYNLATARCPQPELAFCAALSLLSVITGRKIQDYSGTRTNIYVICPAPSGSGKDHSRQINKLLLTLAGDGGDKMIGPEGFGSHAGLVSYLAENEATLFQIDEFADFMEAAGDLKKSPHLAMVITKLLSLYTSSATLWISDALADLKKVKRINQPHCVLYGTCTPDAFWNSINSRSLNGGFIGRLISLEAGYSEAYRPNDRADPPQELVEWVRWWLRFNQPDGTDGNLSGILVPRKPYTVPHTSEARARMESQAREINKRLQSDDSTKAAIWSRSTERVSKLALLFAASRMGPECEGCCIEIDDAEKAIALSNYITRHILKQAEDRVSENDWEAKKKRMLRLIGDGITQAELTRKTQFLKGRERAEAIRELQEAGEVAIMQSTGTTKPITTLVRVR
jgi:hypothetical protein